MLSRLLFLFLLVVPPVLADEYTQSIETWRRGRISRLTSGSGWLTLVGRHPLERGTWSVGSAEGNAIRLAAGPEQLGTITLAADGKVTFTFDDYATGTIDEVMGRSGEVAYRGDKPALIRTGTLNIEVMERSGKLFLRVRDIQAEHRRRFGGIEHYPVDPAWRIEAKWMPFETPRTMTFTNVMGDTEEGLAPGKAVFTHEGKTYELVPTQEKPGDQLFFVLSDATASSETYESGRFLYADAPQDGKVVLDFNKAYNPPCAFSAYTTCPLPPKGNVLPFALRVGEKKYKGPRP